MFGLKRYPNTKITKIAKVERRGKACFDYAETKLSSATANDSESRVPCKKELAQFCMAETHPIFDAIKGSER